MAIDPYQALTRVTLTETIDNLIKPRMPLMNIVMTGATERIWTEDTIQFDEIFGGYSMAPFVHENGKAKAIPRQSWKSHTLSTPYIAVKKSLTSAKDLMRRMAGQTIMNAPGEKQIAKAITQTIAQDLVNLEISVEWRIEWMVAQLLRGSISYESKAGDADDAEDVAFELVLNRAADTMVQAPVSWDAENATVWEDIDLALTTISIEHSGPNLDTALCSPSVAKALRTRVQKGWDNVLNRDWKVNGAGDITYGEKFDANGVRFIAQLNGVNFYEVNAYFPDEAGTGREEVIRDGYIEFISRDMMAQQDRTMHYGALLNDIKAVTEGMYVGKRFPSTQMVDNEGRSVFKMFLKSRPLPFWKHPNWTYSLQAVY